MLYFPLWKKALILGICLLGLLTAFPNFFYDRVERYNDAVELAEAGDAAAKPSGWVSFLPSNLVNLGLDLRGGASLLFEVEVEQVFAERIENLFPEALGALRAVRDDVGSVRRVDAPADQLQLRIAEPAGLDVARQAVAELARPIQSLTGVGAMDLEVSASGDIITVDISEAERTAILNRTVLQSVEIIRRRIDEAGTREPSIQRQGERRILVQVPGVGSAEEVLEIVGTTAKLTFHSVVGAATEGQRPKARNIILPMAAEEQRGDTTEFLELVKRPVITGENLADASPGFDQNNDPAVNFRLDPTGGRIFGAYTAENIGNPFAIVLDDEIISAPVIRSHIPGGSGIISGSFTVPESNRLAILLRAGALPAELTVLEQRTVGPELGADSVAAGRIAALIAFAAVLGFMFLSYGTFGLLANVALIFNVALLFGLLSSIGATLTLPGIAGIVLTVGMAVDANVLIFERIREELKTAKGPARAIELGYERAFSAIIDANITTFIAAAILFAIGSGPVRGFSVTLGLGIVTSVFTAVYVTRLMISIWFEVKRPKSIEV